MAIYPHGIKREAFSLLFVSSLPLQDSAESLDSTDGTDSENLPDIPVSFHSQQSDKESGVVIRTGQSVKSYINRLQWYHCIS